MPARGDCSRGLGIAQGDGAQGVYTDKEKGEVSMAKSLCTGCKHWEWLSSQDNFGGVAFHYCNKFNTEDLRSRKTQCNGKYWENKQ